MTEEFIEISELEDEEGYMAYYSGAEDIPAVTVDAPTRVEAILKIALNLKRWKEEGDMTLEDDSFIFIYD